MVCGTMISNFLSAPPIFSAKSPLRNNCNKLIKFDISWSHERNSPAILEKLDKAITHFTNQMSRMNDADYRKRHLPIGSGVTEAACKTLIKQRLCNSGMKWKHQGFKW